MDWARWSTACVAEVVAISYTGSGGGGAVNDSTAVAGVVVNDSTK